MKNSKMVKRAFAVVGATCALTAGVCGSLATTSSHAIAKEHDSAISAVQQHPGWNENAKGAKWYVFQDGTSPVDCWFLVDGSWYYAGPNAFIETGFQTINDALYYLEPSTGALLKGGWHVIDGVKYHVNYNGEISRNMWYKESGNWYWFDDKGQFASGWQTIMGQHYYFDPTTKAAYNKGWLELDGHRYYFYPTAVAATGWLYYNKHFYYMNEDGSLNLESLVKINGYTYHFNADGTRFAGGWFDENGNRYFAYKDGRLATGWIIDKGSWYYFDKDCNPVEDCFMTIDGHLYHFDVRGVMFSGGKYEEGGKEYYAYANGIFATGWIKETKGPWHFYGDDYVMVKNDFKEIDGHKYHFDSDGAMETSWFEVDHEQYLAYPNGIVAVGWYYEKGVWYYFGEDAAMVKKDFAQVDGHKYFFAEDGAMITDWFIFNGHTYYAYANGMMATGWILDNDRGGWFFFDEDSNMVVDSFMTIDGHIYHFESNGVMTKGWFDAEGNRYYAYANGIVATGWIEDGGNWYYFDPETNVMVKDQWLTVDGYKYYFYESGAMFRSGWLEKDGSYYYAYQDGRIMTDWLFVDGNWYLLDENGARANSCWREDNGNWYHFDENGVMARHGWYDIDGNTYYFTYDGAMMTGWFWDNGSWYYLNEENGVKEHSGWIEIGGYFYYLYEDGTMAKSCDIDGYHIDMFGHRTYRV